MMLSWITSDGVREHDVAELPDLRRRTDGFLWLDIPEWSEEAEAILTDGFTFIQWRSPKPRPVAMFLESMCIRTTCARLVPSAWRRDLDRVRLIAGRYSPSMKAAVHTRYGPPEVVQVTEIDEPTIKADELLIKVHATTVNRTDCGFRAGKPFIVRFFSGLTRPRATVLGNEFAGVVEAIGTDVRSFKVGDRVFGYNDSQFGAHAEYLSIPESKPLAAMPENLTFEQAAPSTEGSHYALSFIRTARIQDGQDVLVYGATGAIGSAAVQLLRGLGANVTAVCSTEYVELVKGLGAERVIDYTVQDFTKDWESYDVVLDAVGKSSFGQCKPLLTPTGLYLSSDLGPHSQNPILALITPIIGGKRVKFPIPRQDQDMARHFKELIESGKFMPVIDRTYPLEQIVEAYEYVEKGQKIGNVVISINPSGC